MSLPDPIEQTARRQRANRDLRQSKQARAALAETVVDLDRSLEIINAKVARNGFTERLRESITGKSAA